jgi:hypothetical protein
MKDHDAQPSEPDPLDALLPGFEPGMPFADAVEAWLDESGGPVAVDDDAVEAALARLTAQPRRRSRWGWGAAALALAAAAALAVRALSPAPVVPTVEPTPYSVSTDALELADGAVATVLGPTLHLTDGALRFRREGELLPPVAEVRLGAAEVTAVPVGTVFVAGVAGSEAAIGVEHGVVRLQRGAYTVAEVRAGEWAVATPDDVAVFAVPPPGLSPAASALLAELRWLSLPPRTRDALRDAGALNPAPQDAP